MLFRPYSIFSSTTWNINMPYPVKKSWIAFSVATSLTFGPISKLRETVHPIAVNLDDNQRTLMMITWSISKPPSVKKTPRGFLETNEEPWVILLIFMPIHGLTRLFVNNPASNAFRLFCTWCNRPFVQLRKSE